MSRLPENIARAAQLARDLNEVYESNCGVIGVDGIGHVQVQLNEKTWQKIMGPRDGVHTVEVHDGKIYYSYTEDGVNYTAVGYKEAADE